MHMFKQKEYSEGKNWGSSLNKRKEGDQIKTNRKERAKWCERLYKHHLEVTLES